MPLNTRPPTGVVAFPLILVEGEEKAGKSYAAYQLSASPKVGRTFVLDLVDGTADEYAELGPYEVLVHDGTHRSMVEQVRAACEVPSDPGKPNVVIVDCGTPWWNLLVQWANDRAKESKDGRKKLRDDPDAEINIPMNIWNDVAARWAEFMFPLKKFPGIGIITAQGKEVSALDGNGRPIPRTKEWKVEAHKSTQAVVSGWVRLTQGHEATLIGVRSLHASVPAGGLKLGNGEHVLERVVFDILGAGQAFGENTAVSPNTESGGVEDDSTPPPFDWSAIGWDDQADHDGARAQNAARARSLDDPVAHAEWIKAQGWTLPYPRSQMEAWADELDRLTGVTGARADTDPPPAIECEFCREVECVCAPEDEGVSEQQDDLDLAYEG
jgi:hypothetical protein